MRPDHPRHLGPAAGCRAALVEHLANATLVVDHFHAIKLANAAIDDISRRVQQATVGRRGHQHDPLYRARRVFLTGIDRLTDERIAWMFEMLNAGDPYGEVGAAIMAKELLCEVYAAHDPAHARRRLIVFFQHCADTDVAELTRLARTIDRSSDEVLAYHTTGRASNGRVENVHMLAEKIRRNAHGFTNSPPLPTPPHRTTRHRMDYRPNSQNQKPSTTLSRVEPPKLVLRSATITTLRKLRRSRSPRFTRTVIGGAILLTMWGGVVISPSGAAAAPPDGSGAVPSGPASAVPTKEGVTVTTKKIGDAPAISKADLKVAKSVKDLNDLKDHSKHKEMSPEVVAYLSTPVTEVTVEINVQVADNETGLGSSAGSGHVGSGCWNTKVKRVSQNIFGMDLYRAEATALNWCNNGKNITNTPTPSLYQNAYGVWGQCGWSYSYNGFLDGIFRWGVGGIARFAIGDTCFAAQTQLSVEVQVQGNGNWYTWTN